MILYKLALVLLQHYIYSLLTLNYSLNGTKRTMPYTPHVLPLASAIFCHSLLVSLNVLLCLSSLFMTKGKCYLLNAVLPTLPFIPSWMYCFSTYMYREVFTDITYFYNAELVICISQHIVVSLKAQAPLSFHKCCWKKWLPVMLQVVCWIPGIQREPDK